MEDRRSTWLLVMILAAAAVFRAIGANNSLWFDEIVTVREYAREPIAVIVAKYNAANNHVMNSVLTHASITAFGEQPWAIRLPAVLFGIGGVWALLLVARRFWTEGLALLCVALFAVSYHHVYYSQDSRGYSAFVFFALLSLGALLRLLDARSARDERLWGAVYVVSIAFGAWSLLLMAFVIAGQGLVLLATRRFRAVAWLCSGVALAALLYAPMAGPLVAYHLHPPEDRLGVGPMFLLRQLRPVVLPLLIATPIGALLVLRMFRRVPLPTLLLLVPLALTIVVFPFVAGVSLYPRTFIYGLPVAYIFLVEAFDWCLPRFRGVVPAASALLVAGSMALLWRFYPLPKQPFREALDYVAARRQPGDRLVGLRLAGRASRFYDPSIVVAEDLPETERAVASAARTWVLLTFRTELRDGHPDLDAWVLNNTTPEVVLRGVIGDGDVQVRLYER